MKTITLLLIFLAPLFVFGQVQIGADINGEEMEEESGRSVSLSADGSIVAIGAPFNDGNGSDSGHVRIYQYTGSTWTHLGQDIDGEATGDQFGHSVSISDDGSIVAIGAPFNDGNGSDSGHVRIYRNEGGTWIQIGEDIEGEDSDDYSGFSLSLNSDGSIVAIGSPGNDEYGLFSGQVRIYQNIEEIWTQMGADINGGVENILGYSVSLSSDGSTVAIGGPDVWFHGKARIYKNISGTWTQIGEDIDEVSIPNGLGWSVSLSSDGNKVAIGIPFIYVDGNFSGKVRIYQNTGNSWTQIGEDIDGIAEEESGYSISLSADGSIVAIGAPETEINGPGRVRTYSDIAGIWTKIGGNINGEEEGDESGHSVSLSDDGSIVAIGAPFNDGNGSDSGHVRVFDLSSPMGADDITPLNFSVYPSPTSGILNINSKTTISQIEVYNLLGQLVKSNTNQNTIDLSSVDQGIYFIKVMDENGNIGSQKVVKN